MRPLIPTVLVLALLGSCATEAPRPHEHLDPRTGVSLTVVDQPLVMARERRDVAVRARDYVTLVAAEINESGRRTLVLIAHQWSTIDSRATDFQPVPGAPILVVADGRDIRLMPVAGAWADELSRNRELRSPDNAEAVTTIYGIDAATLRYIATSRVLAITFPDSGLALPFSMWKDGRASILRLLNDIGA